MCNFVQSISHCIDTGKCFLVGVCTYHHFGKDESGREFRWALKGEKEEEGEEKKRQLKPNTQVKCYVFLCEDSLVVSPVANEKRKQRECEVDTAPTKAWTGFFFWTALAHLFQGHVLANFWDMVSAWYDVIGIRAWVQALIFKIKRGFFAFLFKRSIKWSQIIALFNLPFYTISAWEKRYFSFKDDGLLAGFLIDVTGFHQIQFQWYLQQLVGRDSLQPYSYKSQKALLNIQPL